MFDDNFAVDDPYAYMPMSSYETTAGSASRPGSGGGVESQDALGALGLDHTMCLYQVNIICRRTKISDLGLDNIFRAHRILVQGRLF